MAQYYISVFILLICTCLLLADYLYFNEMNEYIMFSLRRTLTLPNSLAGIRFCTCAVNQYIDRVNNLVFPEKQVFKEHGHGAVPFSRTVAWLNSVQIGAL